MPELAQLGYHTALVGEYLFLYYIEGDGAGATVLGATVLGRRCWGDGAGGDIVVVEHLFHQ